MTDPLPPADPPPPPPNPPRPLALPIATRVPVRWPVVRRTRGATYHAFRAHPVLPLMVTMGVFAAMMFVSFGHLAYAVFQAADVTNADDADEPTEEEVRRQLICDSAVTEGVDTLIVLAGLWAAGRPKSRRAAAPPAYAWALAGPALVLFLGVNVGYTLVLRWLVQPDPDEILIDIGLSDGWWAILLVCVQPAVVEELFFRYLLFGHLRPHLGVHGAAWLSGVVFGMAHLGNVAGWPVLIVLGAGLGDARAYSGSLLLPIGLHFFHNLAILAAGEVLDG